MTETKLKILQISPSDQGGGAELVALGLHRGFVERGHENWLAVGIKNSQNDRIIFIDNDRHRNIWVRCFSALIKLNDSTEYRVKGVGRVLRLLRSWGQAHRWLKKRLGIEDFDYPATKRLLQSELEKPDLIVCHNLHGRYFDLREISSFSRIAPLILVLHDAWLFSGHCALPLNCERWKIGCGECPDLFIHPSVERDATRGNWKRKQAIFNNAQVYVVTPSNWLMHRAKNSLLTDSIVSSKVIPNGIDTKVFYPRCRKEVRELLGISTDAFVLVTAANGIRKNQWKDFKTLTTAIEALEIRNELLVLALGETAEDHQIGKAVIRYVPFQSNADDVAKYYSAADVYVHAAKVESFGNVLLEARACGIPVVSTSVGGIPEHVKGLAWEHAPANIESYSASNADGLLCNQSDAESLSKGIELLYNDLGLRLTLGENAVNNIEGSFTLDMQVETHLAWYREILTNWVAKREIHAQ